MRRKNPARSPFIIPDNCEVIAMKKSNKSIPINQNNSSLHRQNRTNREMQHGESMATRELEIFKDRYDGGQNQNRNPIWLMQAFLTAHKYGQPIPEWVQNAIGDAFQKYIDDSKKNISLDEAFGLKTRGRGTPRSAYHQRDRDVRLYLAIDLLHRKGMTVVDAVSVAHEYFSSRQWNPPNKEKIRQTYYAKWKAELAKITVPAEDEIAELLYSSPDKIRKKEKYRELFETYAPLRQVPSELREFLIKNNLSETLKYLERTPAVPLPHLPD